MKSTLIMRDNLEELNARELADIPVLLGGAALTRSYVERDLRDLYEGRLFYGKDAFEGLHVMDRLGAIKRGDEDDDPEWGRVPSESRVPSRASLGLAEKGDRPPAELPARSPDVVTDNDVFVPPFVGTRVVKGLPLDDIAGYLNETALFRNQWQFRPEGGETDDEFKARIRPTLRDELAKAKADGLLVPQVVYGYFPANGDGNDLVVWNDESRIAERAAVPVPPPVQGAVTTASPTSSGRPTATRSTTPASTSSRWARRSPSARPSCSRTTGTRSTCCSTGSASRWPRRWPSTGTAASARSGASPTRTARR